MFEVPREGLALKPRPHLVHVGQVADRKGTHPVEPDKRSVLIHPRERRPELVPIRNVSGYVVNLFQGLESMTCNFFLIFM